MPSAKITDARVRILVQLCPCYAWMTTHVQWLQGLEAGQFKTHVLHPDATRSNQIFASSDLEVFNTYTDTLYMWRFAKRKALMGCKLHVSNQLYFLTLFCHAKLPAHLHYNYY